MVKSSMSRGDQRHQRASMALPCRNVARDTDKTKEPVTQGQIVAGVHVQKVVLDHAAHDRHARHFIVFRLLRAAVRFPDVAGRQAGTQADFLQLPPVRRGVGKTQGIGVFSRDGFLFLDFAHGLASDVDAVIGKKVPSARLVDVRQHVQLEDILPVDDLLDIGAGELRGQGDTLVLLVLAQGRRLELHGQEGNERDFIITSLTAEALQRRPALKRPGGKNVPLHLQHVGVVGVPDDLPFHLVKARGQLELAHHAQGAVLLHHRRDFRQLHFRSTPQQILPVQVDVRIHHLGSLNTAHKAPLFPTAQGDEIFPGQLAFIRQAFQRRLRGEFVRDQQMASLDFRIRVAVLVKPGQAAHDGTVALKFAEELVHAFQDRVDERLVDGPVDELGRRIADAFVDDVLGPAHADEGLPVRFRRVGAGTVAPDLPARTVGIEHGHDAFLVQKVHLALRVVDLGGQRQFRAGDALDGLIAGAFPVAFIVVRHAHDARQALAVGFQHVGVQLRAVYFEVRETEHGPLAGKGEVDGAFRPAAGNGFVKGGADGRIDKGHGLKFFRLGHHFRSHGKLRAVARRDQDLGLITEKLIAAFQQGKARAVPVFVNVTDDVPGLDGRRIGIGIAGFDRAARRDFPGGKAGHKTGRGRKRVVRAFFIDGASAFVLQHHVTHCGMGQVHAAVHGGELQHFVRDLLAMDGRVKNVDDNHRSRAVVENGVQRLRDGEARKRGPELGRVVGRQHLDRRVHGTGGGCAHQAHNGAFHHHDGHAAVFHFNGFYTVQKVCGHYAVSFAGSGAAFVFAGLVFGPGTAARKPRLTMRCTHGCPSGSS
nr:MAG TPA: hypothetical protein [Caudoviricetes sp.]